MSDRSALQHMLLQRCFLDADALEPIAATDAATPWYFYGCGLTLHDAGIRLAADALLEELAHFRSTQIATYGMSALPLLGAMIARSPRPLTGLFVRKEAKTYGLRRLVEGEGDRARPVVYIDESMTYGGSAKQGIAALEADGYEVEGVLALVDLAGHGTERFFPARGYTKRVVFDVYDDLGKLRDGPARGAQRAPVARSEVRIADGLAPADTVRACVAAVGANGDAPLAPRRFDAEYDASGGFHVSIRRDDDGVRIAMVTARPCTAAELPDTVVLAGARAIASARDAGADLDQCTIALTLTGAERALDLRDLDHRRHVLALRAKEGSWRSAASLPNCEFFQSATGMIAHVKRKGRFTEEEHYDAFAADVVRNVETGKRWPRYGAPPDEPDWTQSPDLAAFVHARARYAIAHALGRDVAEPTESADIPAPLYGVGISLYDGALIGCQIAFGDSLGECIDRATKRAWDDDRFRQDRPETPEPVDVLVTLLHERRVLAKMPLAEAARWVLPGRHTVAAYGDGKFALMLAPYAVLGDYGPAQFMVETARKAKLAPERARWLTFETAAFLCEASGAVQLDRGFRQRAPRAAAPTVAELTSRLARHRAYLAASVQPDGLPVYAHDVERGAHIVHGSTTRLLFAAHALGDGYLHRFLAARDAGTVQRTIDWDLSCDALLVAALDELGDEALLARVAPDAVKRLAALVNPDGAIFEGRRIDGDLDFMSGTVLVALGTMDRRGVPSLDREQLARTFAFYRRRFELVAPWAMTWWHVAGWYAWRHALDTYAFVMRARGLRRCTAAPCFRSVPDQLHRRTVVPHGMRARRSRHRLAIRARTGRRSAGGSATATPGSRASVSWRRSRTIRTTTTSCGASRSTEPSARLRRPRTSAPISSRTRSCRWNAAYAC